MVPHLAVTALTRSRTEQNTSPDRVFILLLVRNRDRAATFYLLGDIEVMEESPALAVLGLNRLRGLLSLLLQHIAHNDCRPTCTSRTTDE